MALRFIFNPLSGQFDYVDGTGGSGNLNVDTITVSGAQEIAKAVTLSGTPTNADNTVLIVRDAGGMFYGSDFTVSGSTLSWSGLDLDGILLAGDELTIIFD